MWQNGSVAISVVVYPVLHTCSIDSGPKSQSRSHILFGDWVKKKNKSSFESNLKINKVFHRCYFIQILKHIFPCSPLDTEYITPFYEYHVPVFSCTSQEVASEPQGYKVHVFRINTTSTDVLLQYNGRVTFYLRGCCHAVFTCF